MLAFAHELAGTSIKVNAACPGHTATDLNNHSGPRSVVEAARTGATRVARTRWPDGNVLERCRPDPLVTGADPPLSGVATRGGAAL